MTWTFSLVVWMFVCGQASSDPGTRFLVTFPQALEHKTQDSFLHVMPVGTEATDVTLVTLPSAPYTLNQSFHLQPFEKGIFTVINRSQMLPMGTIISDMTIEVEASHPVVLEVINTAKSNGDIFSPVPVDDLGTDYFVAGGTNHHSITASFVTVSAPYDDTEVAMIFPPGQRESSFSSSSSERFTLQGVTYFPNDVIKFTLNRLQTMQLQGPSQQSNCPTETNSPGDGIDNDCDSSIDEEPCCINWEPLDMDGDQYKNEDCASQDVARCRSESGQIYACEEIRKSTVFTQEPDTRRQADSRIPVQDARSKFKCGLACTLTPGCWGMNFDPQGREGHHCELLLGAGRGLFPAQGWGFQSMKSVSTYSSP